MKEYLYLFRGPALQRDAMSDREWSDYLAHWSEYNAKLEAEDRLRGGRPLDKGGKKVREKMITDGPYTEGNEVVIGYLIVRAKSLEEAARMAVGAPVEVWGGWTEVLPLRARTEDRPQ